MRIFVPVCVALFSASMVQAQIPNPGFETWASGVPTGWYSTSAAIPGSIQQSSIAHGGSSAARGEVVLYFGFGITPVLAAGDNGLGFPVSQRYAMLSGFYQFSPVGGDVLAISVGMLQGGSIMAGGVAFISGTQTSYAQFDVPIVYAGPGDPDSAYIQVTMMDTAFGTTDVGSSFIVDDLAFSGITSVNGPGRVPGRFVLEQNYPNPFNPSTNVSFTLPEAAFVSLTIFDLLGREVGTLASEQLPPGEYTRTWDGSGQPGGVYFYRLRAGDFTQTRTLLLMK